MKVIVEDTTDITYIGKCPNCKSILQANQDEVILVEVFYGEDTSKNRYNSTKRCLRCNSNNNIKFQEIS